MSNKELDDQYKNSKNSYEVLYDHDDETEVTQTDLSKFYGIYLQIVARNVMRN